MSKIITKQNLAKKLKNKLNTNFNIYLKREDLHPLLSHKGRSLPLMIAKHHAGGWNNFCISSSGNAALASILAIKEMNKVKNKDNQLKLQIFVGTNINLTKLKMIKNIIKGDNNLSIKQTKNPKAEAFILNKKKEAKFLRQSTDEYALEGYFELAKELSDIPNLKAIFIPTSSGTTAQGIYQGFKKLKLNPQIHIIQTEQCHALINNNQSSTEKSLANAIVDKIGHRKKDTQAILKQSNGRAWIANNNDILEATKLVNKTENINISYNSALAIVGLIKFIKENNSTSGSVVCLITGN